MINYTLDLVQEPLLCETAIGFSDYKTPVIYLSLLWLLTLYLIYDNEKKVNKYVLMVQFALVSALLTYFIIELTF